MSLADAAHWAELGSAVISTLTVLGMAWKVVRIANKILEALHYHREIAGPLRAENVRRIFKTAS